MKENRLSEDMIENIRHDLFTVIYTGLITDYKLYPINGDKKELKNRIIKLLVDIYTLANEMMPFNIDIYDFIETIELDKDIHTECLINVLTNRLNKIYVLFQLYKEVFIQPVNDEALKHCLSGMLSTFEDTPKQLALGEQITVIRPYSLQLSDIEWEVKKKHAFDRENSDVNKFKSDIVDIMIIDIHVDEDDNTITYHAKGEDNITFIGMWSDKINAVKWGTLKEMDTVNRFFIQYKDIRKCNKLRKRPLNKYQLKTLLSDIAYKLA